ncbi:MAG TPA: FIST N-terminal domain-containing protein [Gemmataceae bacterium]|nr:FIST N-terminal domain-containing protein [Gemmataceae bacterium]
MPFSAALSTLAPTGPAVEEACARLQENWTGTPDLAVTFFSPHHAGAAEEIAAALRQRLQPRCLLGCVGEAIIGGDREVEGGPALSLWLGRWPNGIRLEPFHLALERTAEGPSLLGWPDGLLNADPAQSVMLLLGDPFTFPVDPFLHAMNEDHRGLPVVGGMASGVRGPGQCRLLLDDQVHTAGAVGVLLQGAVGLRSVVSQGCRPVGRHMVITRAEENRIHELGGRPVVERIEEVWQGLTPEEQELFQQGLHVGLVMNEYQGEFRRGDFLVRNVLGLERDTRALVVNDRVRVGQTVQFHVRDAGTADEDLHALLQADKQHHSRAAAGALLFSCNGRGTRLFPAPDHDAKTIRAEVGAVPLAGFFAQGELGPVGGQNFIHGFTASVALFEE